MNVQRDGLGIPGWVALGKTDITGKMAVFGNDEISAALEEDFGRQFLAAASVSPSRGL